LTHPIMFKMKFNRQDLLNKAQKALHMVADVADVAVHLKEPTVLGMTLISDSILPGANRGGDRIGLQRLGTYGSPTARRPGF